MLYVSQPKVVFVCGVELSRLTRCDLQFLEVEMEVSSQCM